MMRYFLVLLSSLFAAGVALADDYTLGSLKIHQPWARATPNGAKLAGAFLTVTNTGSQPDRLVGGTAQGAQEVQVHEMQMDGNVMRMRRMEKGLEIPPGATVVLKPGSYHLMLQSLAGPLVQGTRVKGTLQFERAGKIDVEFAVAGLGTMDPDKEAAGAAPGAASPHAMHGH